MSREVTVEYVSRKALASLEIKSRNKLLVLRKENKP